MLLEERRHAGDPLGLGGREIHEFIGILRRVEELGGLASPTDHELPRPLHEPELRLSSDARVSEETRRAVLNRGSADEVGRKRDAGQRWAGAGNPKSSARVGSTSSNDPVPSIRRPAGMTPAAVKIQGIRIMGS